MNVVADKRSDYRHRCRHIGHFIIKIFIVNEMSGYSIYAIQSLIVVYIFDSHAIR